MILFENSTLFFQAIGRSGTAIRELSQLFQFILIFLLMKGYVVALVELERACGVWDICFS